MKINISELEYYPSFEMEETDSKVKVGADAAKYIGNLMKYSGGEIVDIGFEDLAREIYYCREAEITSQYAEVIKRLLQTSPLTAALKRCLFNALDRC